VFVVWLLACGGASSEKPVTEPAPPVAVVVADAGSVEPTAEPEAPVDVSFSVANVMVAGPRSDGEVKTMLEARAQPAEECFQSTSRKSIAVEITFAVTKDGRIPQVNFLGKQDPKLLECLGPALGAEDEKIETGWDEPTDVYALVMLLTPADKGANAPAPPSLFDDMTKWCDVFRLSGATKLPVGDRAERVATWMRTNIRHPAVFHMLWEVVAAEVGDKKSVFVRAAKAAGLKSCGMAGF
jgi:hypothetical protein